MLLCTQNPVQMFKTWVLHAFLYFGTAIAQRLWNSIACMERHFQEAIHSRLPVTWRFYTVSCSLAANFNCFSPSLRSPSSTRKAMYLTGLYLGERERPLNELKAWKWLFIHLLRVFQPVTFSMCTWNPVLLEIIFLLLLLKRERFLVRGQEAVVRF